MAATPSLRSGLVHDLLDETAARHPLGRAVRDARGSWTYQQVVDLSHAVAGRLAAEGVGHGDRVIVRARNRREIVPLLNGIWRIGAVAVPLNPAMKPFHLRSVLADAEPKLVLTDAGDLPVETAVPVLGLDDLWPDIEILAGMGARSDPVKVVSDDLALLIYTSGSTAAPKAVVCPHARVSFAASSINAVLGYRADDVVFCRLPLSFDYGLYQIMLATLGGSELVLAGDEPDPVLLRLIGECGATVVPLVPSLGGMLVTLAGRGTGVPGGVRMFTNTGAALPESTIGGLRTHFPGAVVVRMYGITECKRVTIMEPELEHERPGAVGRALPGTRVLILDDEGRPVPPGTTGEIVVAGPNVMAGYWRAPDLTERVYRPDPETGEPRLHTGDYGRLDDDGYLYFEGRRDDMFKRRGTRMSTVEIEAAAMDVPGVRAAAALPPGEGHDLVIFVEGDLEPHEVLRGIRERLEPAKTPAVCHVLPAFPLTLNGKNERKRLALLLKETLG
ncbi:AMP-binding protein [Nonomuraea muscovyensis]|uniref:Amino acid adenylation domain-containing protein n=1 Tax=Nonomuraea muscovyensis TaxID=1124761 RepID=A0A7X0CDQ8_9ACTN|nr:AMP-binding protein [Nonomuraea muscovyensis]MBB6351434.1 amino acid adenylation domain-containing protein [Nonomuraea muscovyensis]